MGLFTQVELDAMARRLKGEKSDPTGAFSRARKKLLEIQAWHTPTMRKHLHTLLKQKRTISRNEQAAPNEEKSFEEFRQEVGY